MHPSRFLLGVDSDGTAFDSMNIKHLDAFIPAALEIWPLSPETAETFSRIEKNLFLYSPLRGINRFPGLLETFERLEKAFPGRTDLPDLTDFRAFIAGETCFSPAALMAWLTEHPSAELEKVLAWSIRADERFSDACEGLQPFPGVQEALAEAFDTVSVAVVSSATRAGLEKCWFSGGLMPSVDFLMDQEDGGKTIQLRKAMSRCGESVRALMLGDTENDCICAHEAGALFYPILPGDEAASWQHFRKVILPLFLSGCYNETEEARYCNQLKALLN